MMWRRMLGLLAGALGVAAAVVLSSHAQEESTPSRPTEFQQLQEKIVQLEARVEALEKQPARVFYSAKPAQDRVGPTANTPRHWSEHDFNGQKFYIVPLGNEAGREENARPVFEEPAGKSD